MHAISRCREGASEPFAGLASFSVMTGIYCIEADDFLSSVRCAGVLNSHDAEGIEVKIDCGSWVRFRLALDEASIKEVKFTSNGCGVMIAAAESIARRIEGKRLTDLGGIKIELAGLASDRERQPCIDAALNSLKNAFAAYREKRLADAGETAIACTCFGVSIDIIEAAVSNGALSEERVTAETRAGGGCGSCRMLIREILDNKRAEIPAL